MILQLLLGTWIALVCAYIVIATMRWHLGRREDDHLHFSDSEQQLVATQSAIAHRLDVLDRWSKVLLTLVILWGVVVGGTFIYMSWEATGTTIQVQ